MAKKIRFPLAMDQGVEVRSIKELKENFSLTHVLMYISNGKLVTWLRDRYEEDIAKALEELDLEDEELPRKVCRLFDVIYDESTVENLEKVRERNRKQKLLEEYSSDMQYLKVIDFIAFDQDDLYDLLDDGINEIYLCGDSFLIPLAKKGIKYIGINKPVVIIDSNTKIEWEEKEISMSNVKYDDKYQAVLDSTNVIANSPSRNKRGIFNFPSSDHNNSNCNTTGHYQKNTYLSSILSRLDKIVSEIHFRNIYNEIISIDNNANYDFVKLIEDVNSNIKKKDSYSVLSVGMAVMAESIKRIWGKQSESINTSLALIFDYNKLNDYGRIIMQKSSILLTSGYDFYTDVWTEKYTDFKEFKNESVCLSAAKEFVKHCDCSENIAEAYKFIFWALLILTVEKTDLEKHLSLICDFAQMFNIPTSDELEDIVYIIKVISNEAKSGCVFKSESIRSTFQGVLDLYKSV